MALHHLHHTAHIAAAEAERHKRQNDRQDNRQDTARTIALSVSLMCHICQFTHVRAGPLQEKLQEKDHWSLRNTTEIIMPTCRDTCNLILPLVV